MIDRLYRTSGCWLWVTLYPAGQARALLRAGGRKAARAAVDRAMAELEPTGERGAEAELHRILGDIRAAEGEMASARDAYETAISVARHQNARSLDDRAAAALGTLARA